MYINDPGVDSPGHCPETQKEAAAIDRKIHLRVDQLLYTVSLACVRMTEAVLEDPMPTYITRSQLEDTTTFWEPGLRLYASVTLMQGANLAGYRARGGTSDG